MKDLTICSKCKRPKKEHIQTLVKGRYFCHLRGAPNYVPMNNLELIKYYSSRGVI